MGRRKKDDVFLIGEETLVDQSEDPAALEPESGADQERAEPPSARLGHRTGETARPRGRLAAIALVVTGLAAFAATELLGSGSGGQPTVQKTSARPALIQAPVAAAPEPPASPRRADPPGTPRRPSQHDDGMPGREPAPTKTAPSSPPSVVLPIAESSPEPAPPGPPPPSSGGGQDGAEDFGFER